VIASLLFATQPDDARALAAGASCLLVVALIACYIATRRAKRADPVQLLRAE
jgi:ABC-type lipoprotein release transport system permease subunit